MDYLILKRILKGNSTVGFVVQAPGFKVCRLTKADTIKLAKQGLIINARTSQGGGLLLGKGMDLRKLPTVQYDSLLKEDRGSADFISASYQNELAKIRIKAKLTQTDPSDKILNLIRKLEGRIDLEPYLSVYNGHVHIEPSTLYLWPDLAKYATSVIGLCQNRTITKDTPFAPLNRANITSICMMCNMMITEGCYLDFRGFDTSRITNANDLFSKSKVDVIGLEGLDTSNIKGMSGIFHDTSLQVWREIDYDEPYLGYIDFASILDLSAWNTRSLEDLNFAFAGFRCAVVGLNNWDVSNVVNFQYTFKDFYGNGRPDYILDLSNWKINPKANTYRMFTRCSVTVKARDERLIAALKETNTPYIM